MKFVTKTVTVLRSVEKNEPKSYSVSFHERYRVFLAIIETYDCCLDGCGQNEPSRYVEFACCSFCEFVGMMHAKP